MLSETSKGDEIFMTSNTRLATCLLALGHKLHSPPCTRQVRKDGRTIVTFLFNPAGGSTGKTCSDVTLQWVKLEEADPGDHSESALRARIEWLGELSKSDDAVDYCYAVSCWRDLALNIVKSTPRMVETKVNGKLAFFREDATPEDISKMTKYL
jgi:hypothetical protein